MANNVVQIVGLLLSLVSGLCTVLAVVLPDWRRNDIKGEVIETIIRHQGIWIRCISFPTGLWQCDDFDAFFLGLPVKLQIARALALLSVAGLFFSILLSVVGMQCTNCMSGTPRSKCRVALLAAGFWIFSALAIGSAVSFYAHEVVQDYTFAVSLETALENSNLGLRYVFGTSLFLGWAAMALGLVGGAIMMCGSCYVESDDEEYWNKGKVGKGIRRVRNSFRESYRSIRPRKMAGPPPTTDYV